MSQQAAFTVALLDPMAACPAGLTAWNGSDPSRRFAVYRNNVITSLIDALADTFPVTLELVGEAFFRAMAGVFVRGAPPTSAVLADYGVEFPAFIEQFAPASSLPYLADVARLEWLRLYACHAADAEPLSSAQIAQALAEPARLPLSRWGCHPSLGLLDSCYAVVSLWAAHQGIGDLARVVPDRPETALIVRAGLEVQVMVLPPGAGLLIAALADGVPFAEAAARAAAATEAFDLTAALALLLRAGVLCSFHPPPETVL